MFPVFINDMRNMLMRFYVARIVIFQKYLIDEHIFDSQTNKLKQKKKLAYKF